MMMLIEFSFPSSLHGTDVCVAYILVCVCACDKLISSFFFLLFTLIYYANCLRFSVCFQFFFHEYSSSSPIKNDDDNDNNQPQAVAVSRQMIINGS